MVDGQKIMLVLALIGVVLWNIILVIELIRSCANNDYRSPLIRPLDYEMYD